jgi:hypothetical protein
VSRFLKKEYILAVAGVIGVTPRFLDYIYHQPLVTQFYLSQAYDTKAMTLSPPDASHASTNPFEQLLLDCHNNPVSTAILEYESVGRPQLNAAPARNPNPI